MVRHENGQWQNRTNKNWQAIPKQGGSISSTRPNRQPSTSLPSHQQLNRQGANNRSFDHQKMNRELHGRQMGNMSRGGHQPTGNARRAR